MVALKIDSLFGLLLLRLHPPRCFSNSSNTSLYYRIQERLYRASGHARIFVFKTSDVRRVSGDEI